MLRSKVDIRAVAGGLLAAIALLGLIIATWAWPLWVFLLAVCMILTTLTLSDRFDYECQKCHATYKLGIKGILTSRHGRDDKGGWAISRCPQCGAITKARESRSYGEEKE